MSRATWAIGLRRCLPGLLIVLAVSSVTIIHAAQVGSVLPPAKTKAKRTWKLSAISSALPDKLATKLRANIEKSSLVCWDGEEIALEIPFKSIIEISRDDEKSYPASAWLMAAANRPSAHPPRPFSRAHREEMEARLLLRMLAVGAMLFPKHHEVVRLRWTENDEIQEVLFRLDRHAGRALLGELQIQTGLGVHDLEKERKEHERQSQRVLKDRVKQRPAEEPALRSED